MKNFTFLLPPFAFSCAFSCDPPLDVDALGREALHVNHEVQPCPHEHADPPHAEQSLLEAPVQDHPNMSMTTCSSRLDPRDTAGGKRRERDG